MVSHCQTLYQIVMLRRVGKLDMILCSLRNVDRSNGLLNVNFTRTLAPCTCCLRLNVMEETLLGVALNLGYTR